MIKRILNLMKRKNHIEVTRKRPKIVITDNTDYWLFQESVRRNDFEHYLRWSKVNDDICDKNVREMFEIFREIDTMINPEKKFESTSFGFSDYYKSK